MSQTVLITGASGGLGLEFARIFAANGYDLILTARSEDRLREIAAALSDRHSIHVDVIRADLSTENGADDLYAQVRALGRQVDQFVNNAGAGKAASTITIDPDELKGLLHLDVTSYAMLCRYIGADMAAAGHGRILNISSTTAFFPDPYFNIYGPSKAFVMSLTEAMAGELKGTGVSVTALCPGPVRTNWAVRAGKAYPAVAADPAKVARTGYKAMQAGRLYVIPGIGTAVGTFFLTLLPRKLRVAVGEKWQRSMIHKADTKGNKESSRQ